MTEPPQTTPKFDVIATNIKTGAQRVLLRDYDEDAAKGAVIYAVIRRGAEDEFFSAVPAGSVRDVTGNQGFGEVA